MGAIISRTVLPILLPVLNRSLDAIETIESTQESLQNLTGSPSNSQPQTNQDLMQQLQNLYRQPSPLNQSQLETTLPQ
jgi:hypothetical protein